MKRATIHTNGAAFSVIGKFLWIKRIPQNILSGRSKSDWKNVLYIIPQ
jgi:hypothetical protein